MACTIILAFIGVNPDLIGLSPMIQRQQYLREAARFISENPYQISYKWPYNVNSNVESLFPKVKKNPPRRGIEPRSPA